MTWVGCSENSERAERDKRPDILGHIGAEDGLTPVAQNGQLKPLQRKLKKGQHSRVPYVQMETLTVGTTGVWSLRQQLETKQDLRITCGVGILRSDFVQLKHFRLYDKGGLFTLHNPSGADFRYTGYIPSDAPSCFVEFGFLCVCSLRSIRSPMCIYPVHRGH